MTVGALMLRNASSAFAPVLAELHARSVAQAWPASAFTALLTSPGVAALVAVTREEEDERPVGFILMRLAAGEAEILTVSVLPAERGKGVGLRLLEGALEVLRARGACEVFLEVGQKNAPAKRLYERAGFAEVGRRPGYYRNEAGLNEDAVTLRRAL